MAPPPHTGGIPVVLDGGMSNGLEARGNDVSGHLWTARMLRDAPQEIAAVHRAYFDAGARVATTASYQASVDAFVRAGATTAQAQSLIRLSVTLAREVRDELAGDGVQRWVAASVGPYGAALADGSEYRGRYGVSRARLREFHLSRLELLASARPDLLAVETVPDVDEAEVLVELLDEVGMPAWVTFSCNGTRTRAGQPLGEAFEVAAGGRTVFAIGINCCRPADVLPALEVAAATTDLPAVAYPNGGATWDASARRWAGGSSYDPADGPRWVAAGATYVGGCCEVGPDEIASLAGAVSGPAASG